VNLFNSSKSHRGLFLCQGWLVIRMKKILRLLFCKTPEVSISEPVFWSGGETPSRKNRVIPDAFLSRYNDLDRQAKQSDGEVDQVVSDQLEKMALEAVDNRFWIVHDLADPKKVRKKYPGTDPSLFLNFVNKVLAEKFEVCLERPSSFFDRFFYERTLLRIFKEISNYDYYKGDLFKALNGLPVYGSILPRFLWGYLILALVIAYTSFFYDGEGRDGSSIHRAVAMRDTPIYNVQKDARKEYFPYREHVVAKLKKGDEIEVSIDDDRLTFDNGLQVYVGAVDAFKFDEKSKHGLIYVKAEDLRFLDEVKSRSFVTRPFSSSESLENYSPQSLKARASLLADEPTMEGFSQNLEMNLLNKTTNINDVKPFFNDLRIWTSLFTLAVIALVVPFISAMLVYAIYEAFSSKDKLGLVYKVLIKGMIVAFSLLSTYELLTGGFGPPMGSVEGIRSVKAAFGLEPNSILGFSIYFGIVCLAVLFVTSKFSQKILFREFSLHQRRRQLFELTSSLAILFLSVMVATPAFDVPSVGAYSAMTANLLDALQNDIFYHLVEVRPELFVQYQAERMGWSTIKFSLLVTLLSALALRFSRLYPREFFLRAFDFFVVLIAFGLNVFVFTNNMVPPAPYSVVLFLDCYLISLFLMNLLGIARRLNLHLPKSALSGSVLIVLAIVPFSFV